MPTAAIDVQNRVAQALAQLPAEVQQNGVSAQARQQSAYGGKPLLAAGHTDAAVCQQLRQHLGARGAGPPARRRRGADVWRPGLQHAYLAAPGPHERAQHHHG